MSTWQDLRELRMTGRRPARPLCVTTLFARCVSQAREGAMVVVHEPGERFDVAVLHGLDVEFFPDDCSQASAVARVMREREVQPKRFAVWCRCDDSADTVWPRNCAHGAECAKAWEALCRRAR